MTPTQELYTSLQKAYDHFNKTLFDGALPEEVIFTTQRIKSVMGYFSPDRWASPEGKLCHEIAINPEYVARSGIIELLQTLAHEQVHAYQHIHGNASRRSYHNKEWADKMIEIGLMPSDTGLPGGRITGQKMSDYPISDGAFVREVKALISKEFSLPWVDRRLHSSSSHDSPVPVTNGSKIVNLIGDDIDEETLQALTAPISTLFAENTFIEPENGAKNKVKCCYQCPGCKAKVWGKPRLSLMCLDCEEDFVRT